MKFQIIKPKTKECPTFDGKDVREAAVAAGLELNQVDHGMIHRKLGIMVYEFSLFVPPAEQSYFSLGGRLYAGNAVLYSIDDRGETVDMKHFVVPHWLPDREAVEKMIAAKACARPQMAVNGEVLWRWPEPAPRGMTREG